MKGQSQEYQEFIRNRSETLLKYLGECAEEVMLNSYEEAQYDVNPETELRILSMAAKFYKQQQQRERKQKYAKLGKVAVIIAIVIITMLTTVIGVDALRLRIYNFLFEDKGEYQIITPVEVDLNNAAIKEQLPKEWNGVFYPNYLPEGYEFIEADSVGDVKIMTFQDNAQNIINFSQNPWDGNTISVDNEDVVSGQVLINGNAAFWSTKGEDVFIVWVQNETQFILSGPVGLETLSKMVENFILIK